MNYVPFGEKAMTLTVNLYLKTAHEPSVIEGNILQNIIDVSQIFLSSHFDSILHVFVCLFVCLHLEADMFAWRNNVVGWKS